MRNLEREIANLTRKAIKEILMQQAEEGHGDARAISRSIAGVRRFRYGEVEETDLVGVTTGLAWTEVGGELLSIEAVTRARQGQGDRDRQARRRDEGIGAGGGELRQVAQLAFGITPTTLREARTSTSTCPRAPRPRTVRRPASRW